MEIFDGIGFVTFDFDNCKKIINTLQDVVHEIKIFSRVGTVWLHLIDCHKFHLKRAFIIEIYKNQH